MAGAALAIAGVSAGLDLMSGLFGYFAGQEAAGIAESKARMIRMEADADAQRYAEQARGFKASQKLAFLKSGVALSGSPLDILDETARVSAENLSAIRAGGEAKALDAEWEGAQARIGGRNALIGGITGAAKSIGWGLYNSSQAGTKSTYDRKDVGAGSAAQQRFWQSEGWR